MTLKEYLKNVYALDVEVNSLVERVNQLQQEADGLQSMHLTDMPRGGCPRTTEDIISDIIDLQYKYAAKLDALNEDKRKVEHLIEHLTKPEARAIMRLRYVSCKRWDDVAAKMGYSVSNVYTIHGRALSDLNRYYESEEPSHARKR